MGKLSKALFMKTEREKKIRLLLAQELFKKKIYRWSRSDKLLYEKRDHMHNVSKIKKKCIFKNLEKKIELYYFSYHVL